jgi:hypothetical protein
MIKLPFGSTRAIADLVLTGTLEAHSDLGVVMPHGGAMLPLVADPIEQFRSLFGHDPDAGPSVREHRAPDPFDRGGAARR